MPTTDKLRALGLTIENEKKKEANSSERVGKTFGVAADAIDALDVKIDSKADSIAIQNDLQALENKIADATTNFKGYHISIEKLNEAYPSSGNKKDFLAWVGSPYPGTVYKVYADNGAWTDTGEVPTQQEIDLAEYLKKDDLAQNIGDDEKIAISQAGVKKSLLNIDGIDEVVGNGVDEVLGENIFDNSDIVSGKYLNGRSNGVETDAFGVSFNRKYVSVKSNTLYETDLNLSLDTSVVFYDSSKNFISYIGKDLSSPLGYFTTPINCAYIRYNFLNTDGTEGYYISEKNGGIPIGGVYFDNLFLKEENIIKANSVISSIYKIDMRNTNTFVGAMNTALDALLKVKPRAKIVFISHFTEDWRGKETTKALIDTQIKLAKYWCADILDLSKKLNLINRDGVNNLHAVVPDDLHPGADSTGETVYRIAKYCTGFLYPIFGDDWTGKKIAWYGTSIPYGHPNPSLYAYPVKVAAALGASIQNYAVSGSVVRLSTTSGGGISGRHSLLDTNQAINYKTKLIDLIGTSNEPDVFVFDYGINDFAVDESDFNI